MVKSRIICNSETNQIDTEASNALISIFENIDYSEECDTLKKCHIISKDLKDEDVHAYLANAPSTGPNESGENSDSDFHSAEDTSQAPPLKVHLAFLKKQYWKLLPI